MYSSTDPSENSDSASARICVIVLRLSCLFATASAHHKAVTDGRVSLWRQLTAGLVKTFGKLEKQVTTIARTNCVCQGKLHSFGKARNSLRTLPCCLHSARAVLTSKPAPAARHFPPSTCTRPAVQGMHSEWSPGQPCQPGDFNSWGGTWPGCRPYGELNLANLNLPATLWPSPADKLLSKENMQSNGNFNSDQHVEPYTQYSHWKGADDLMLSPYLREQQYQQSMPAASAAPNTELQTHQLKGV